MKHLFALLLLAVLPARAGIVTNGSNNGATNKVGHSVALPLSITATVMVGTSVSSVAAGIGTSSADNTYVCIVSESGLFKAQHFDGSVKFASSGVYATNTWRHVAAVFESASRRVLYVDGASVATNTTVASSLSSNSGTTLSVGGLSIPFFGGFGSHFAGTVAEAAFWTNALTASDVAVLATGAGPQALPYTPLRWFRLTNTNDLGGLTGSPATLVNTPVNGNHPRIYRP